jgi:hypothetical protein
MADKIPKFDDLPLDKAGPPLNAWGLSDSPPTARLIMLIAFQIRQGRPARVPEPPDGRRRARGRQGDPHRRARLAEPAARRARGRAAVRPPAVRPEHIPEGAADCERRRVDVQHAEQQPVLVSCHSVSRARLIGTGDGLRHYGYQKEARFYNGVTLEDIHGENKSTVNGIHGTTCLPSPS